MYDTDFSTPGYSREQFFPIVEKQALTGLGIRFDLAKEAELSYRCEISGLHDPFRFRIRRRSLFLAKQMVNEEGEIEKKQLQGLIDELRNEGYIFYPEGTTESEWTRHALFVAEAFEQNPELSLLLRKFRLPLCHKEAEERVRLTLQEFGGKPLTTPLLRMAVLASCFDLLRQTVGSCFATAPAVLSQTRHPERVLSDLLELLLTGKLTKTFGGKEYSAPLSPGTGTGDLYRTFDPDRVHLSPGLLFAFLAGKRLRKEASFEENIDTIRKSVAAVLPKLPSRSAGNLLEAIFRDPDLLAKAKAGFQSTCDNPLLKSREFTMASFSESKIDVSQWNFFSGLGLSPEKPGGIGETLREVLEEILQKDEKKLRQLQEERIQAENACKTTEILASQASSQSEMMRLRAEFQRHVHQARSCQSMEEDILEGAKRIGSLFSELLTTYKDLIGEHFQEVYDSDMYVAPSALYEDSPGGFRAMYKHGRSNASLWSFLYTETEYVEALVSFFLSTEPELTSKFPVPGKPKLLSDIVTALILRVRSSSFVQGAFSRVAQTHKILDEQDLSRSSYTPWSYPSGGSMTILLQTYYKRESPLTEESCTPETQTEIASFFVSVLQNRSEESSFLASSPSHAFIVRPDFPEANEAGKDNLFPYSLIRDRFLLPTKEFYEKLLLSRSEQQFLRDALGCKEISPHPAPFPGSTRIVDFRNSLLPLYSPEQIDAFLYESLPLVSGQDLLFAIRTLTGKEIDLPEALPLRPFFRAKEVKLLAEILYIQHAGTHRFPFDLSEYIEYNGRKAGLAPPAPFRFADTGWPGMYFAFLTNPGTGNFELFRTDKTARSGTPMPPPFFQSPMGKTWHAYPKTVEYS